MNTIQLSNRICNRINTIQLFMCFLCLVLLGEEMKPLARLHLTRQRIYPQKCEDSTNSTTSNSFGNSILHN